MLDRKAVEILFWACAALVAWTYALYPLALALWGALCGLGESHRWLAGRGERRRAPLDAAALPTVSLLIAAHDEEAVIGEKIVNSLALDYPPDRLEIWIGADGCTDRTEEIVRACADPRVRLSSAPRAGKAAVLNRLAALAQGDVLVMSDANTRVEPGALRALVRHFGATGVRAAGSERVGLACGRLRLFNPRCTAYEESAYWKYENLIKFLESRFGLVMGANGALYAMPRALWRPLPPGTVVDDFAAALGVLARGRAVVYEPEAVAHEETTEDYRREFRRRARIAAGNFQALIAFRHLLLPRAGGIAAALWSHKVVRWLAPLLLAGALGSSAALALDGRGGYAAILGAQIAFYAAAAAGSLGLGGRLGRAASAARYFVTMNAALVVGLWRFVRGTQRAAWERTARGG